MNEATARSRPRSIDDWYALLSGIYFDRNYYRSRESILCHLVEVVGGLSIVASGKIKKKVVAEQFLAKSIGWWMALCDHVGIRSVDEILWMKFPAVCSYCRERSHLDDRLCARRRKESGGSPDWLELRKKSRENQDSHPTSITGWLDMFQVIYPRSNNTNHEKNFSHLTEELGELSEAVRSLPLTRSYFLSEASDVFAWLMGVANQLRLDAAFKEEPAFDWEEQQDPLGELLWRQYPGKCRYCNSGSCKCAPFPKAIRGRIVTEGPSLTAEAEGAYFTLRDKLQYLDLGDAFIEIAGTKYQVGHEAIVHAEQLRRALEDLAKDHAAHAVEVRNELRLVQDQLALIGAEEAVTQGRVTDVLERLDTLPTPERQVILDHLAGLNVGVWLEWIKVLIHGSVY